MSETTELPSTRTWDGAASASASKRAQEFEKAWKAARGVKSRPDPLAYLPENPRDRPAVLLALLRTELGLRYESGENPRLEDYRTAYPDLDEDSLVALIYEDFCLREEADESPVPVEYEERFPDLLARLRRVFDIHDLVGSGNSLGMTSSQAPLVAFPEVGQTIAGFHLRDELGRGSFARVFLAEERQLADRPVALKVARTGSREPQTLARLQHTHIVPVHSYRIDPATELHLLCMPFFGRITLERLLNEPAIRTACTGADLLAVLDRLDSPGGTGPARSTRSLLCELPFARAMSLWGARMAEALAHAHERGVMHRDIKPSNVLITSDGLPMLLDFNLAREPWDSNSTEPEGMLGGTLAYMAPEQLDAIAEGRDDRVDGRADVYSLGVLLFEALTGARPFPAPTGGTSVRETLYRAAEIRRASVPSIRSTHPEMPVALEAVILRCLNPNLEKRHPDAASLAADLQAVADERPLPFTREPISSRARRWVSRHRFGLTLTVPLLILASMLVNLARQSRDDQSRIARQINDWVSEGIELERNRQLDLAAVKYQDAARLASDQPFFMNQPPLAEGFKTATARRLQVKIAAEVRDNARQFLDRADRIHETLQVVSSRGEAQRLVQDLIQHLDTYRAIARQPGWSLDPALAGLDPEVARRLEREYDQLSMAQTILAFQTQTLQRPVLGALCDQGREFSKNPSAWSALKAWITEKRVEPIDQRGTPGSGTDHLLTNALVHEVQGLGVKAIDDLKGVIRERPGDFWCRRQIAHLLATQGATAEALIHLDVALALNPTSRSTLDERARLNQQAGRSNQAQYQAKAGSGGSATPADGEPTSR